MSTRTLFIGMDGSTFTILDQLVQGPDPVMPFLAERMPRAARGLLRSTANPLTPPAWVSLMTGRNPGHHGIFDFLRSREIDGELYTELSSALDCRCEMIWSIASRQGRSVAALNLPFTAPPPRDLNGIVLPGFVPWKHLRRNTQPSDFYRTLKEQLPDFDPKKLAWDFEHEEKSVQTQAPEQRMAWVSYHLERDEQWFNVARFVLAEVQPDLMAVMFDGTDKLQHQVWPYICPGVDHDAADDYHQAMRALSLQYFRNVDRYIATLTAMVGPEVRVVLASDHGFTGQQGVFYANEFLRQAGHLEYRPDDEIAALAGKSGFLTPVDVRRSRAYCRTPSTNGIFIRGDMEPAAYEAFRDQLTAELLAVTNPATGESIVTAVSKREDIFPGAAMADAPDLTLTLRDHGFLSIRKSATVYAPLPEPIGTHHPDGVFLAWGPGIPDGARLDGLNIVDVAAILLDGIGLPVPADLEGRVPEALFTESHRVAHPSVIGAPTVPPALAGHGDMANDEKDALMGQLAALGYVG